MGKKWTILNRYISVNTDIMENDLCFLNTLSTAFRLVMFVYPNLNAIFLLLFLFLTFFLVILLRLSTFKPLNALYLMFQRLKISGRISVGMKLGVPG